MLILLNNVDKYGMLSNEFILEQKETKFLCALTASQEWKKKRTPPFLFCVCCVPKFLKEIFWARHFDTYICFVLRNYDPVAQFSGFEPDILLFQALGI